MISYRLAEIFATGIKDLQYIKGACIWIFKTQRTKQKIDKGYKGPLTREMHMAYMWSSACVN